MNKNSFLPLRSSEAKSGQETSEPDSVKSCSVNKVLLKRSRAIHLWLLSHQGLSGIGVTETYGPQSKTHLVPGPLQETFRVLAWRAGTEGRPWPCPPLTTRCLARW